MHEFEMLVRTMRGYGVCVSIGYLIFCTASGVLAVFNIHPEHRTANIVGAVMGIAGFLLGMFAWFPRQQMYLVDRKDFPRAKNPFILQGAMSWSDGKILVVKTHALVAVALSLVIFVALTLIALAIYS